MNGYPLIVRRMLHSDVAAGLRDMILNGSLTSGQRIIETDLCG